MVSEQVTVGLKIATATVVRGGVGFGAECAYHSAFDEANDARTQSSGSRMNQLPDFAQAILRDNPELVAQLRAQVAGQNGALTGGASGSATQPSPTPAQPQNSDDGTYELDWSEASHKHNKVRIVLRKASP